MSSIGTYCLLIGIIGAAGCAPEPRPPVRLVGHNGGVTAIVFSPDGAMLATAGTDETVRIWEVTSGKQLRVLKSDRWNDALAFSPDGKTLACSAGEKILLYDTAMWQAGNKLEGHSGIITQVAFFSDGSRVASCSRDKTIKIWDVSTGRCCLTISGHLRRVNALAVARDMSFIVSGSDDETVRKWDAKTGKLLHTFEGHRGAVTCVAVSANGSVVASGANVPQGKGIGEIKLWNTGNGAERASNVTADGGCASCVIFTERSDGVLAASCDSRIYYWRTADGRGARTIRAPEVHTLALSADYKWIGIGSMRGLKAFDVTLWEAKRLLGDD
jgi:WD40 repeat protein